VSGDLLSHISTADTARDLEVLRKAVGDRTLTYVGLSYGTMIGQTYANLFPGRVRAMMLDAVVDAVDSTTSAEARTVNNASSADEVFEQFVALCQSAAPGHCALAGHGETVAQRVAGLFATARQAPIPAPNAKPPGQLSYGDLLNSTFNPLRLPDSWPKFAEDLDAAANGDASKLETRARELQTPEAYAAATTSAAISCLDGPARLPSWAWPLAIRRFTGAGKLWGSADGMVAVGTVRLELAGPQHRPLCGPVERQDHGPDPADQRPLRPRHRLPQRAGRRAAARQRRAAHHERLRPPELPGAQHVHRRGQGPLPRRSRHPTARLRLPTRQGPVPLAPAQTEPPCDCIEFHHHRIGRVS
jgi:pimeloyl-ACP methyl ester carboxylesterase